MPFLQSDMTATSPAVCEIVCVATRHPSYNLISLLRDSSHRVIHISEDLELTSRSIVQSRYRPFCSTTAKQRLPPGGADGDLITISCDSDSLVQRNNALLLAQDPLLSRSGMKWRFDVIQ